VPGAPTSATVVPTSGFLLTLHVAATWLPEHALNQQLQLAAGGFSPNRRALMTLVSLNTSRSPAPAARAGRERCGPPGWAGAIQQARAAALGRRVLGNQLGGQGEIEIAEREGAHEVLDG
jgi:hypothetical protein